MVVQTQQCDQNGIVFDFYMGLSHMISGKTKLLYLPSLVPAQPLPAKEGESLVHFITCVMSRIQLRS